ncbi:MAG: hypothetical protein JXA42_06840 [Anaerolineales bacterium]|nr:hypothetical protein [Anaerolineales bacterium]
MAGKFALFQGLISIESGEAVDVTVIGGVSHYVIPDEGFMRHVEAVKIDRQVLEILHGELEQHRDMAVKTALEMIGKDDLFTKAMVDASINNMERLLDQGIPEDMRAWLGMVGFRVIVDYRGQVVRVDQPGQIEPPE